MYVLLYALECILMYLQTCTYALVHRLSNAFRYVPKNKHAYYFFCNYGHFLGFFMLFFGISIAINTNLTEIFSKIFLILFLILSRSTGAILGNFGEFQVIWGYFEPFRATLGHFSSFPGSQRLGSLLNRFSIPRMTYRQGFRAVPPR